VIAIKEGIAPKGSTRKKTEEKASKEKRTRGVWLSSFNAISAGLVHIMPMRLAHLPPKPPAKGSGSGLLSRVFLPNGNTQGANCVCRKPLILEEFGQNAFFEVKKK
jgi:hypothetical protein